VPTFKWVEDPRVDWKAHPGAAVLTAVQDSLPAGAHQPTVVGASWKTTSFVQSIEHSG
jgi:hypothetical protein